MIEMGNKLVVQDIGQFERDKDNVRDSKVRISLETETETV